MQGLHDVILVTNKHVHLRCQWNIYYIIHIYNIYSYNCIVPVTYKCKNELILKIKHNEQQRTLPSEKTSDAQ